MPCTFTTHPEVVVDSRVPIEEWTLSAAGRARAALLPDLLPGTVRIVSSAERKATDAAGILGRALGIEPIVDVELGEMDRSATGYLEPAEFEAAVDAFFARPGESVRGWERAVDAQRRIERAVRRHAADGTVFVAHGGVGALLLASLNGTEITRDLDQPGMGSRFAFDPVDWRALSPWSRIG